MQNLLLRRVGARTFELGEDFHSECGIIVPKDFRTDGLSIPYLLRWISAPTGVGFNAAVVHDYLLYQQYPWKDATAKFKEQMLHDDVPNWRIKLYVQGVKIWGLLKY